MAKIKVIEPVMCPICGKKFSDGVFKLFGNHHTMLSGEYLPNGKWGTMISSSYCENKKIDWDTDET